MSSYNYGQPGRSYGTGGQARTRRSTENDPLLDHPPSYNSIWTRPTAASLSPQPKLNECCECARYSFFKVACSAAVVVVLSILFLLPNIISALKNTSAVLPYTTTITITTTTPTTTTITTPTTTTTTVTTTTTPTPPPTPEPPYRRAGLSGDNVPLPGSAYIISEANSSKVLTYDGNEGVMMADYHKGLMAQQWGCHEADGWFGFTVETGHTTLFLGYSPWPSPATLRCSARTLKYSEMFTVWKLPEHGFRLVMKDGKALKPVGRDNSGALAMIDMSDVWWRFTKI